MCGIGSGIKLTARQKKYLDGSDWALANDGTIIGLNDADDEFNYNTTHYGRCIKRATQKRKAVREAFGNYIVSRQRNENLHKPFQCYKDDYVEYVCDRPDTYNIEAREIIKIIVTTHASDLNLFDIKGDI